MKTFRLFLPTNTKMVVAHVEGFRAEERNQRHSSWKRVDENLYQLHETDGTTFSFQATQGIRQPCSFKYLIGVRPKGDDRIHFIEPSDILKLQPNVKEKQKALSDQVTDETTKTELRTQLVEKFGSKTTKKRRETVLRNVVKEQEVSQQEITAVEESVSESVIPKGNQFFVLPPINMEAKDKKDAYPLHGVIMPREWRELEAMIDVIASQQDMNALRKEDLMNTWDIPEPLVTDYFMETYERTKQHLICCLFLKYVAKFHVLPRTMKRKEMNDWKDNCGIPLVIFERFLQDFTEYDHQKRIYFRSPLYTDKLINYALVAWLHLMDFNGDPQHIAGLLGLTPLRALLYLRQLGCKVESIKRNKKSEGKEETKVGNVEKHYWATLQVPVQPFKTQKGKSPKS